MSLRIAPHSSHSTSTSNTLTSTSKGAPSAPGLHDTLRTNLSFNPPPSTSQGTVSAPLQSTHPLEARLKNWQSTQESLRMSLLRREFGMGEPVRRGMEMKICREAEWVPSCVGGSARAGEEILAGRDAEIVWEDVYRGGEIGRDGDVQVEIEARVGLSET